MHTLSSCPWLAMLGYSPQFTLSAAVQEMTQHRGCSSVLVMVAAQS